MFIVIFTALIVTIIAVSFTQLMIRNQQQATANDLSQRAYNSALAGVEDGKRVLVAQDEACKSGPAAQCNKLESAIAAQECDTTWQAGIAPDPTEDNHNQEVVVGSGTDNQAYTCVTIQEDTPSYHGTLTAGTGGVVVPLRASRTFNRVKLTWFTSSDAQNTDSTQPINLPVDISLPPASNWGAGVPPILRAQYIPVNGNSLDRLDKDAKTAFLYPFTVGSTINMNADSRRLSAGSGLQPVTCASTFEAASSDGVCQAILEISGTRTAYLQLASLYNNTSFTVQLCNGNCSSRNLIDFHDVQPVIDSTGRAGDLFRRVQAHVSVKDGISLPYPNATLYVKNNLCKTFFVTNRKSDYDPGSCTP